MITETTLRADGEFVLCRRRGPARGQSVLELSPTQERPGGAILDRLAHEYALKAELDPAWAARPRVLVREHGRLRLLLDDPGGEPLARRLGQPLEPAPALRIALALAEALAQVHARGLIHKDLTPGNVLVDADYTVRLTGFGIASRLPRERQPPEPPEVIAGTLAYMAPEQTGRMNRSIDARSDLYALGVILYQMLTGELPFTAADPMEWVHCHIARPPAPPAEKVADLPAAVSDLVMKLLAKTAEERYQSAAGVAADLRRCLDEWSARGTIGPFPLGSRDVSDQLRIPEKLYGREAQVQALVDAFGRVVATGTPELVLVAGYSGIGKSAVVNELQRVIVPPRGLFAAGKFEQYRRGIPYDPLAQALRTLVRQLLAKSEAELGAWREELRAALGPSGALVVDLVPELALVVGPQPSVADMPPGETENRFNRVLGRFLGVFARAEHPLILFLDDLQWLDPATLRFLAYLLAQPDTQHLLAVGAYRDNEVDASHSLQLTLDAVRKTGTPVEEIVLAPLALAHLAQLLADALHCPAERTLPLARLVLEKTGGNPFFAIQFITALNDEGLIAFDRQAAGWSWDLEQIRGKGYTDNVVELMLGKLKRLPPAAQDALGWMACLGRSAEVRLITLAREHPLDQTEAALWPALRGGFVLAIPHGYKFIHDRVQEAAYALIPAAERPARHLAIGRHLLSRLPPESLAERLFDVVGQLNRGEALITDPTERETVGRLNASAGRRAKEAVAYAAASEHLARATALLPAAAWRTDYAETFALHLDRAECEYLAGRFELADQLFEQVLSEARVPLDRARACRLRSRLCQMAGRYDDALKVIVDALAGLGVTLPDTDAALLAAGAEEIDRMRTEFIGRTIADLIDLPKATDPAAEMTVSLLVEGMSAAYATRPAYFPVLSTRAVSHSLRYGNSEDSCFAYQCYAVVLIAFRWDLQTAFEFSELALSLLDRFDHPRPRGTVQAGHGGLVLPWRRHMAEGIPFLEQGLAALLEAGDFRNAGMLTILPVWNVLEQGSSLDRVLEAAEKYAAVARQVHNELMRDTVLLSRRFAANLKGLTDPPTSFDGDGFSEADCLERFGQGGWHTGIAYFQVMKLIAGYLYGHYREALAAAAEAEPVLGQMMAMQVAASLYFYRLLTLAALYPEATSEEQRDYADQLKAGLARLEFWAGNCPENFGNRHALVAAEVARLEGRALDAERFYEAAIASARDNGFTHLEALANELAARFYLARGFDKIACTYLRDARYHYQRWGALGKVKALDAAWPQLAEPAHDAPAAPATIGAAVEQLDVATVVKASQAVSSDIVLDRLIETLMRITLEHAGADRGLLILPLAQGYRIAARATAAQEQLQVSLGHAPPAEGDLPQTILHYVARTHETVLLDDASAASLFSEDPYLADRAPRSILSLPLVRQGKLAGIVYLENNQARRAFTRKHVAVLELLAAQAAISLENATLYADLRESREKLGAILGSALDAVVTTDAEQRIILFNASAEQMFGYTAGQIIGEPLDRLVPERFRAAHRKHVRRFGESGATRRKKGGALEVTGLRANGEEFQVDAAISQADAGGQKLFTAMLRDVTERKRMEAEQRARQSAEAESRAKSEFLANMSHELRSPLNTILGFTRLMVRDPALPEATREDLRLVLKSGEHLHDLISDVLDMSKLEAGRTTLNEVDFELDFLLDEIKDMLTPPAARKGLQLLLARQPGVPRKLRGDALKLRQVLINLIGNALKFTAQGSVTIAVEAQAPAAGRGPPRLCFAVTDTGPGIARNELGHLFDAFVQARAGRESREGTGLGLAISRGFVRLMGGEMQIDSEEGRGTTIRFDIPLRLGQERAAREEHEPGPVIGVASGQPRYRILVVDDQAEGRRLLVRLLTPCGFDVREAANGAEAVAQWREWQPDFIWMDLRMPVLGGLEATRRIRAEQTGSRTPIIAVTASASEAERQNVLAAGCDDILRKPYREAELFAAMERHLGVRFVYQGAEPAPPPRGDASPALLPAAPLPAELRAQLELAIAGLDPEAIHRATAAIEHIDARLAQTIAAYANDFQYDEILALIKESYDGRR